MLEKAALYELEKYDDPYDFQRAGSGKRTATYKQQQEEYHYRKRRPAGVVTHVKSRCGYDRYDLAQRILDRLPETGIDTVKSQRDSDNDSGGGDYCQEYAGLYVFYYIRPFTFHSHEIDDEVHGGKYGENQNYGSDIYQFVKPAVGGCDDEAGGAYAAARGQKRVEPVHRAYDQQDEFYNGEDCVAGVEKFAGV